MRMNKQWIAIDSDGCAFDTMTLKHKHFFYPEILHVFGLDDHDQSIYRRWLDINLYEKTRGVNRFLGLYLLFNEMQERGDIQAGDLRLYHEYITHHQTHNVESLKKWIDQSKDSFIEKVLRWSENVNRKIDQEMPVIEPFDGVLEFLKEASKKYQLAVVSSANQEALYKEWSQGGLLEYVDLLTSQNDGTKTEILADFVKKGIPSRNILMIGDAPGDQKAAKENDCFFEWIKAGQESVCFERLKGLIMKKSFSDLHRQALNQTYNQIKLNLDYFLEGFPHVSEDGKYKQESNRLWTASFFPGMTYLAYQDTKDPEFLKNRDKYLDSFRQRCYHGHMDTHDIGFLFLLTFVKDYQMDPQEETKKVILDAADKLMERYYEKGGFIQAWGKIDEPNETTRIIIDCMMNVEFLMEVSKISEDEKYADAAIAHAKMSAKTLVRQDGSTYHTYYMNKKTGQPVEGKTHQGHRDESTWARGQAWSVYGFARMYQLTKEPLFLDTAIASAKVFIKNLPHDFVHYWDFDFTDSHPDIRDSSAASIGATGLIILDECVGDSDSFYYDYAGQIVESLIKHYMVSECKVGSGILTQGMYHRNEGFDESTSWGDYYFLEALLKLKVKDK